MSDVAVSKGSDAFALPASRPVVTIGNFDGVHVGHRALIDAARRMAGDHGTVVVLTFSPFPRDVFAPEHGIPSIQSLDQRIKDLLAAGADHVVVEPFTRELALRPAAWFCDVVLRERLGAVGVVVGHDFRFGKGRAGTDATLRDRLGVAVEKVEAVTMDGVRVSSTVIREAIARGDVGQAARWLGRPHRLVGDVIHGDARGRGLGFPTANIDVQTPLRPPPGVYAVRARWNGQRVPGVANYGHRPTFGAVAPRLEVHLLDGAPDLYGERLEVELVERIREERAFPSAEALVRQIADDVVSARGILA